MHEVAQHLSAMGRKGDSMLVHMSPQEVSAMNGIAALHGTNLGRNPDTGLPEAFNLGGFFKSLLPTIVGIAAAPFSGGSSLIPVLAGAATGAALNGSNPLMGALTGGLGGFGGAGIGSALGKSALASTAAPITTGTANAASAAANQAAGQTAANTLSNVANPLAEGSMANALAQPGVMGSGGLYSGFPQGVAGGVQGMVGGPSGAAQMSSGVQTAASTAAPSGLSSLTSGLKNLGTEAGRDAYVQALGGTGENASLIAAGKTALPLGLSALSAIEPPKLPEEDKYDPNFQLNLSGDSGLRFYAEGGDVNEMPDPGSNPLQNAQDAFSYGIGGLSYAKGGGIFDNSGLNLGSSSGANFNDSASTYSPAQFEQYYNAYNQNYVPRGNDPFGGISSLKQRAEARGVTPQELMRNPNVGLSSEQIQFNNMMRQSNTFGNNGSMATFGRKPSEEQLAFNQQLKDYNKARMGYYKEQNPKGFTGMFGNSYGGLPAGTKQGPLSIWQGNTTASSPGMFGGSSQALFAKGGYLDGPGDGMSDSIPATIGGKQPARLADGEFVVPADVVSHIGNGSTKAGAQRLYDMMAKVRKARTGTTKQGKQINPKKYLPA
jgi:hypothetical protein